MHITFQHDRDRDQAHLIFRDDKIISATEWFASNAYIEIAADGTPIAITFCQFYSQTKWPLTEEHVKKYHLEEYLDELRLVYKAFFTPANLSLKRIENEHGILYERSDD